MTAGADNPEEDSSGEFEGLHARLTAEPVSLDQADARVDALLQKHLEGRTGPFIYRVDESLPPETVIKVQGQNITVSRDAHDALQRHMHRVIKTNPEARAVQLTPPQIQKPKHVGEPYKGS